MQYGEIPYVDKPVSRLFYGTASMPFVAGGDGGELLDAMLALGVNAIDTARVYGMSEASIGQWMASRHCREQVVLLTKGGHPDPEGRRRITPADIRGDIGTSCELLQTDYIDVYLLHRDDPEVPVGAVVELLNALHEEGRIGAFGGSNWTVERIAEANAYAAAHGLVPFSVSSPNFGLAEQVADPWGGGCVTVSGPSNAAARAWYAARRMPVIAYSSLGRGFFSGRVFSGDAARVGELLDPPAVKGYACPDNFERLRRCEELAARKGVTVPQLAMRWIFAQELNTFAVVSTSSPARMQQNIDALQIPLTAQEADYLDLRAAHWA